jgi:hypothetical protein
MPLLVSVLIPPPLPQSEAVIICVSNDGLQEAEESVEDSSADVVTEVIPVDLEELRAR